SDQWKARTQPPSPAGCSDSAHPTATFSVRSGRTTRPPSPSASRARPMAERNGRRAIKTDFLARVEGEGAMRVVIRDGSVDEVELRIYEPPRFFEAFL